MKNSMLFKELSRNLEGQLELLPDKPEETVDSTLSALWLLAAGEHVSAEKAQTLQLPELTAEQKLRLKALVRSRLSGVPLAHITGRQQFMGVELISNSKALIPRKETELLGYTALEILKKLSGDDEEELCAFDLCCGAGNLSVALALQVPEVRFFASDLSGEAVDLTRENIRFHLLEDRIEVYRGSVLEAFKNRGFEETVDLIICNPPYISDKKVPEMAEEIAAYEPDLAFKGGMLGMCVITELIREAPMFLKKGGWLAFEVGLGQGAFVEQLCVKTSLYSEVGTVRDREGNIRVIKARK